jgi:hypothetical protein
MRGDFAGGRGGRGVRRGGGAALEAGWAAEVVADGPANGHVRQTGATRAYADEFQVMLLNFKVLFGHAADGGFYRPVVEGSPVTANSAPEIVVVELEAIGNLE